MNAPRQSPAERPRLITREPEDGWLLLPDEKCPLRDQHTPCPSGFLERSEWAERMLSKGMKQHRCEGCHRWAVWVPKGTPCLVNGIEAVTVDA